MFSRARSLRGVWSNLKFIAHYKTWATLCVVIAAMLLGVIVGLLL